MTARSRCGLAFVLAVATAACQGKSGSSGDGGESTGGQGALGEGSARAAAQRQAARPAVRQAARPAVRRAARPARGAAPRAGLAVAAPVVAVLAEARDAWQRRFGKRRLGRGWRRGELHRVVDVEQARQEPPPRRRQHLGRRRGDGAVRPPLHLHLGRPVRFADAVHGVRQRLHGRREGLHQRLRLVGLLQHAPRHVRRLFHPGRGRSRRRRRSRCSPITRSCRPRRRPSPTSPKGPRRSTQAAASARS